MPRRDSGSAAGAFWCRKAVRETGRRGKRILRAGWLLAERFRLPSIEVRPTAVSRRLSPREVSWLISPKGRGTSHLSLPWGKRRLARATETFPNEREAKEFARAKLVDTPNVIAGTLNPHLPKRTIAATLMLEWLEEPHTADLA
jgi:hypothetical protein